MKNTSTILLLTALSPLAGAQSPQGEIPQTALTLQEANTSIGDALGAGTHWVKMRLRYEGVDQDSFVDSADALTLRTLLGYQSGEWNGFSATIEAEDVSPIGDEDYNSTVNGNAGFPVVADPNGTEMNQAFVQYNHCEDTSMRAGRQRIVLGDARFVGNVGWRQNEQTYDGYSLKSGSVNGLDLFYAHLTNVNRIFGESSGGGNHAMASNLVQAGYDLDGLGHLEAFLYDLDYTDNVGASTSTLGASLAGDHEMDSNKLLYRFSFAQQSDAHDNTADIDANYMNVELGFSMGDVTVKVGQELLGGSGDPGDSFKTPLATLHKFNGWADKFLNTPDNGLEDTYFSVGTTWEGTKLLAVMHQFSSDEGDIDYGEEMDLLATRKLQNGMTAGLKYADYTSDTWSDDTTKIWLWLAYSF